ncbi:hypothetical protein [Dysgonomonas sp. 25]|uniref:hypothetical protein n=1 Tax=Dysgonomonas sp. 25 TaxID=2302933 RepID=UPI0013D6174B|nr:hypothetical protein [Dysgonomonas sp. 25]NDV69287.1 hypothetical protein [Dysgonomonas sp. 25]
MKTMDFLKFAVLAFIAMAFFACGSDDDKIKLYSDSYLSERITQIDVTTNKEIGYFWIKGGDGFFTASSDDRSIIEIVMTETNRISYAPKAPGKTTITVSDGKGNATVIPVEVKVGTQVYYHVDIEPLLVITPDPLTDPSVYDAIKSDIAANNIARGNMFHLTYKNHLSGDLIIYNKNTEESGIRFEGEFRIVEENRSYYFIFTYNGEEHRYERKYEHEMYAQKDMGPINLYLFEDLTEKYATQYPAAGITKIEYILHFYTPRY